jgi:type I restriction enzyme S subunit
LGALAIQVRGVTYKAVEASKTPQIGKVAVVRASNIVDGELTNNDLVYVPASRVAEKQWLKEGDVLIATSSGSLDVVGKAARVRRDEKLAFGAFCKVLRPTPQVDAGYFAHFFQTGPYRRHVARVAEGANINNLRNDDLANIQIPMPPMVEQRRIAAILDAADALRAKRRATLVKLDELTQAVFHDMFDDATAESAWPKVRLVEICQSKGEYGANVPAVEFECGKPRYLRITDIRSDGTLTGEAVGPGGTEDQWRSKILRPGDIVFARSGATVGKTFLMRDEDASMVFAGYLIKFVPDQHRVLPEYLYQFTRTVKYRSWVAGAATTVAQPNVNASKYAQLELSLPPMALQRQFVDAVERIRHHRTTLEASAGTLDTLFASLQQRAFRGEL